MKEQGITATNNGTGTEEKINTAGIFVDFFAGCKYDGRLVYQSIIEEDERWNNAPSLTAEELEELERKPRPKEVL